MSFILHEYRNWVRCNPQTAQQFEQITRLAVFLLFTPQSLLTMEASHSFINVIGDINQSVLREEEEHLNYNQGNPVAQDVQRNINTSVSVVRLIRETQNCGELLVRKLARKYLAGGRAVSTSSSSASLAVQLYVLTIELTKLFFRMKQNEDIWKIVLPQMLSFSDVFSTSSASPSLLSPPSSSSSSVAAAAAGAASFAAASDASTIRVPHIIHHHQQQSSASSTNDKFPQQQQQHRQKLNLTRPDKIGLWIDLIDLVRPVVTSVALAAGSIWHRRRALHKAWAIWLIGLAYELIAWVLHNYYLKRYRGAFLRESTGALVQQLHDRSREQLIGVHLLKYPFFNLIAEPELRTRVLAPTCWVAKIPLIGGIIQGLVEYQVQLQKQCVLYSSGS